MLFIYLKQVLMNSIGHKLVIFMAFSAPFNPGFSPFWVHRGGQIGPDLVCFGS